MAKTNDSFVKKIATKAVINERNLIDRIDNSNLLTLHHN